MKKITLFAPASDNAGRYLHAGATVEIGNGKRQISATRAELLLKRNGAVDAADLARKEEATTPDAAPARSKGPEASPAS